MAQEEMYGYFPGGDPRRFRPDVESATIEEIADWKEMCRIAEEEEKHGGRMSCPPAHRVGEIEVEGVRRVGFISTNRFGPGSWYEEVEEPGKDVVVWFFGDEDPGFLSLGYIESEEFERLSARMNEES